MYYIMYNNLATANRSREGISSKPVTLKSRLSLRVIETDTIRKLQCGFLFVFYSNYGAILYRLQDIATYWSKIANCLYPTCIWTRAWGDCRNFAKTFDTYKTRMIELPCSEETMTIC